MSTARTLSNKLWDQHVIVTSPEGEDLLYVDFNYITEGGAFMAFDQLRIEGRKTARPLRNLAITDHYLPTKNREAGIAGIANLEIRNVVQMMADNASEFTLPHLNMHHPRQGIVHVVGPELGFSQPGMLITCNDSHTSSHGAFGALAFGIGASNQLRHILATQTVWARRPKTMRITINGALPVGVTSKDVILSIIGKIGIGGASGFAVEYAGSTIRAMSMEARMTVCNMSIEAGARMGMIAPDDTTFQYLEGRMMTPKGKDWERALVYWKGMVSDAEAAFERELHFDASQFSPMVTWGTNPEDCLPIDGAIPDPINIEDAESRKHVTRALEYMGLRPATPLTEIHIDQVFIGSCTNSRIEDLRAAAVVLKGRKAAVPGIVSPGSSETKRQAEAEGLDVIFRAAGLEWRDAGCAMCNGSNGEIVEPGQRCASTTNRNFEGRQGRNAMTHIMSPAMVAAAAIAGRLADVRQLPPL